MKVLLGFLLCTTICHADEDGQYRGDNSGAYVSSGDDGQYIPDNSGQYIPDYSGLYGGDNSGRYAGDGSGQYRDNIAKYVGQKNLIGAGTNTVRRVAQPTATNSIFVNRNPVVNIPAVVTTPQPAYASIYNANKEGRWKIIRQLSDIDTEGGYHWEYETENKIQAEESGKLFNKGTDAEAIRAKGFFQYTGPDNVVYSITYTADENGFVPVGNHLPTPPPIPGDILKSLQYQS